MTGLCDGHMPIRLKENFKSVVKPTILLDWSIGLLKINSFKK